MPPFPEWTASAGHFVSPREKQPVSIKLSRATSRSARYNGQQDYVQFLWLENLPRLFYISVMKTVPAAKFKEQCLALLDRVGPDGILITKHGKPVAKLVPVHTDNANLIGSFKGKIKIKGNILNTGIKWNAES
jgi:prevent-host-death family protein